MIEIKIEHFITNDISVSWDNCMKEWRKVGRIEDFLRCERRPKYLDSPLGKKLGKKFAEVFRDQFGFVIGKLYSNDKVEYLCAFECLEYMSWNFYSDFLDVPEEIYNIKLPLPEKIMDEIGGDLDAEGFKGNLIGEFIKYITLTQLEDE